MDFKKLMQYASANQMLTEKKHERKKQRQEEERNEELVRQVEEERRAARRLKEARAKAEKKRREYKGLVAEAAQAKQTSSSSSNPSPTATNATSSKTKTGVSSGTVKKVSNLAAGSKPPPRTQTGAQTQKQKRQQPPDFVAPATSSNCKGKAKAPVNFQDLLKIAQKKSGEVAEKEKNSKLIVRDSPPSRGTSPARPDGKPTPADARTCRGNSPVGKSLLDRTSCRVKKKRTHDEMEKTASSANDAPDNSVAETTIRGSKKAVLKPTENGIHPKGSPSLQQPRVDQRSTGGAGITNNRPSQPKAPAQPQENRTRVSLPQARQRQRSRPGMDTLKTKSFYGAASAKLASAERPAWRTRHTPMKHTSAWVDEMSDYLQRKMVGGEEEEEFYSDDEEEDDMADFVASDEEEEDYSSAIQQIFGYDKRRFAEEKFDDRIMESSYAQQMFEEQRSARIGQQEDQEDLMREQAELARKRQKKMGPKSSAGKALTQTKLRFR